MLNNEYLLSGRNRTYNPGTADTRQIPRVTHTADDHIRGVKILREAMRCWEAMGTFRRERERNKRYTYGRQWDDLVVADGVTMTEENYIKQQGSIPLKNNLIRRMVRNILGVFRNNMTLPKVKPLTPEGIQMAESGNKKLDYSGRMNAIEELYARTMEEFLISGLAVHRKWYGSRDGREGCLTDYVNPEKFFLDTTCADFRGNDVELIGEIHDMNFDTLCAGFANDSSDYQRLSEIYSGASDRYSLGVFWDEFGVSRDGIFSFLQPRDSQCRVFEIWRREHIPRYRCHDPLKGTLYKIDATDYTHLIADVNRDRPQGSAIRTEWFMDDVWRYYFITPTGEILREGDSPYRHGSHPYIFKAYPFIDGEIHSFVNDVIDQQRHTNRLITLYDWVMRASAKGVLLFPESSMPDGWDISDVAEEWSRFNGVIMIKAKEGIPLPQQVSSNATNIGISELLNIQLKMFEDVSGVNGALQGKLDAVNMSGTLYSQQTNNAMSSLLDLLQTYNHFMRECTRKELSILCQFSSPEILPVPSDSWTIE